MSTHKNFDRICVVVLVLCLLLTLVFVNGEALGIQAADTALGYETRLFDTAQVHTIDIVMDDWDGFIETCENEEYSVCSVVIDGEAYKNVGIRAKGNTSLSTVSSMNSDRYSFKIEFDQYDTGKSYHGLDKLSLNNIIQDSTYMKDYLTYQMMGQFGVAAPLCSFAYITVNGEDWGLYLAVESIEDSFLQRNYGSDYGDLYKPDSTSFGGGRGNGKDFNMEDFDFEAGADAQPTQPQSETFGGRQMGGKGGFSFDLEIDEEALRTALEGQGIDPAILDGINFENLTMESIQQVIGQLDGVDIQALMKVVMSSGAVEMPDRDTFGGGGGGMGMGSSDVLLQYSDDDPDSYSNIFDSAKTDVTDADQERLINALKTLGSENAADAVDVDAVIRYFVVHNYVVNGDSYTGTMIHNYYLYEDEGKLAMLPWDYNLAFGSFQGNSANSAVNDPIDTPLSVTGSGDRPIIDWIFSDEAYTELYHQYFTEFLTTVDIQAMIDQAAALIAPYVEKDPTAFFTYEAFETGVAALKEFCILRSESVQGQLDGTIPSTDAGQSTDSAALVDASQLNLSDMGSMGMGGGGGGFIGGRGSRTETGTVEQPAESETTPIPGGMTMPGGQAGPMPDGMTVPGGQAGPMPDNTAMPGGMGGGFPGGSVPGSETVVSETGSGTAQADSVSRMPENTGREFSSGSIPQMDTSSTLLWGASIAVLLLGLVFALVYKRRK